MRWEGIALSVLVGTSSACATGSSSQGSAPVAYRMVAHPASGAVMPRIELRARPGVEQAVNDQLDDLAANLACDDPADGTYETRTAVTLADYDVLSVQVTSSFYCGGPYPTNRADSSVTFDLRTGEAVPFRALFADYARARDQIARVFLASLSPEDFEGCDDVLTVEELGEQSFSYTISGAGLRVESSFPHVIEACNRDSVLPFAPLLPFAAPGGILTRVADAAHPES